MSFFAPIFTYLQTTVLFCEWGVLHWSHATTKKGCLVSCSYSLSQCDRDPATPKHLWSLSVWYWCPWVSASSLLHFLLFKWFSPLQAKEGHVPEKSCISNQTFKFLTAPKVLNILSTDWKLKPLCIPTASTSEHHRELRSTPPCTHGEEGGMELPSALLVAGNDITELPQSRIAFPVPKASMTSSEQGLCSSEENIPSQWGVGSASGTAVHMLGVSHSPCQCFSGPRYPESHTRDVAKTDLVHAENLSKIQERYHLFLVLVSDSLWAKAWISTQRIRLHFPWQGC